jgi:hypothetical protein
MGDALLFCGEHDGSAGFTHINKVRILRLVLFSVDGDSPYAKVVNLLVYVEGDPTEIVPALRLEDADGFTLALRGAALGVNKFDVLVVQNYRGGVLVISRRRSFGGVKPLLRHRLIVLAKRASVARVARRNHEHRSHDTKKKHAGKSAHDQFPFDSGARVNTSCCWSAAATFW